MSATAGQSDLAEAHAASAGMASDSGRAVWLFSPGVDLAAFLGSAVVSLAALAVGAHLGVLHQSAPEWTWVSAVLLIDVAHVYATGFRVYFDSAEFGRRRWLYTLTPLLGFVIGAAVYSESPTVFWRVLAYLAVFHFVRQQYGWVALYRSRAGEREPLGKRIDTAAIYLATVYPLIHWHSHLPRRFWWFLEGDFASLPAAVETIAAPLYWGSLAAYAARSAYRWLFQGRVNPGKDIVVATTAVCWYAGIVTFNSDYAFTVTNVMIHGVPYLVLVYWYWIHRRDSGRMAANGEQGGRSASRRVAFAIRFLLTVWALAYVEELFWDRGVWHERGWLFGAGWEADSVRTILIPLLAVPQVTHYVLDGFIWRRRRNPAFTLGNPSISGDQP